MTRKLYPVTCADCGIHSHTTDKETARLSKSVGAWTCRKCSKMKKKGVKSPYVPKVHEGQIRLEEKIKSLDIMLRLGRIIKQRNKDNRRLNIAIVAVSILWALIALLGTYTC